ncbi:MAG TPA: extracellular solute-binding protein, partial [Rhizomicrobium sp.]|nr:extracellular solute-binding protein [Rhizomicrobium sp.]
MRAILMAAVMAMLASQARAAEIQVRCPALVHGAMQDFAAGFQRQTGTKVTVISGPMGKMVDAIQTAAAPPDVVILPPDLMDALAAQGGVKSGTRAPLARVEIGLAVAAGAARPDISSVERLRAALLGAKA